LINAFHEVSPELAEALVENSRVRGRIIWSLNNQDWADRVLDAIHLITAIHRASPAAWLRILARVTAVLDAVNLESVYARVREENFRQPLDREL
jgi:hypothetical protein